MIQKILSIVMVIGLVFVWSACQDSTTEPTKTKLQPVTSIKAYSVSNTSVGLKWTKSTDESKVDFLNYSLKAKNPDGTTAKELTITKGIDSALVTGLTNGIIYTFEVISKVTTSSTNYLDGDPVTVKWSPAWRFDFDYQSVEIKLYETSSNLGKSGLIFYNQTAGGVKPVSIVQDTTFDIFAYSVPDTSPKFNRISLRSAHLSIYGKKYTRFANFYRDSETLNNPQISPPDTSTYIGNYQFTIDSVVVTSSRIYYFKGDNGNYGRILVMRNPDTGRLIWGTSPDQYLKLKLSYQSVAYNPYSKKSY